MMAVSGGAWKPQGAVYFKEVGVRANLNRPIAAIGDRQTPHFDVVRSRLPRHPKPVPPIFEPEVAADAVVWAADHPRREVVVGFSTLRALLANKIAPGFLDRYLARSGYDSQQTDEAVEPDRPDNLWDPVPGDRGAHGIFADEARRRSLQFSATKHRQALAGGVAVLAGLFFLRGWRRSGQ